MGVASGAATTSVEVRDADDGRLVATGTATHRGDGSRARPAEQDVGTWWDGMVDAVEATGLRAEIAGLSVAGQRQALVLLDGAGAPIGPASVRTDRRGAATAAELAARLGSDRLARATGQVPGPDSPLARLVWRLGVDPGVAEGVAAVLGAAETLTARLTGRRVTDRGGASATGWWDPIAGQWRLDLLDRVARPGPGGGWAGVLPEVLGPSQAADRVSATVHELVGLRGRPLVAAGTSDVMARALAVGARPGAAVALLDAEDPAVVAVTATAVADPSGRVAGFADAAGTFLPTVPTAAVGGALAGVARLLGTDAAGLAARAARPGSAGPLPIVLPARHDGHQPDAPGAIVGLDGDTTPGQLARGALVGVAAEVLEALAALDAVGGGEPDNGPLVLSGAVARWPGVAATVAELTGREVVVTAGGGAATGAAVQAAAALHGTEALQVAAAWGLGGGERVEPSGDGRDADAALARHAAIRAALAAPPP